MVKVRILLATAAAISLIGSTAQAQGVTAATDVVKPDMAKRYPLRAALTKISASQDQSAKFLKAVVDRDESTAKRLLSEGGYRPNRDFSVAFVNSRKDPSNSDNVVYLGAVQVGPIGGSTHPVGIVKINGVWVEWDSWDGNWWW